MRTLKLNDNHFLLPLLFSAFPLIYRLFSDEVPAAMYVISKFLLYVSPYYS